MKPTVLLLGGTPVKYQGKWQSNNVSRMDFKIGAVGSKWRVLAGYLYWLKGHNIIVSGGKSKVMQHKNMPAIASVMKKELIRLGVPANNIFAEKHSIGTYQQLGGIKKIVRQRKLDQIIIISNNYHLPRVKIMMNYLPKFKTLPSMVRIQYCSAESVLLKHAPRYQPLIKKVYASQAMRVILRRENKGIKDIKNGRYIL